MSRPAFDKIIPVKPPIVNNGINPKTNKKAPEEATIPPYNVAN
jgi:hypothetical protein